MSLDTWKQIYYSVRARDVPNDPIEATKHSLLKWRGLMPEVLEQHELKLTAPALYEPEVGGKNLSISDTSCALCHRYAEPPTEDTPSCHLCPLYDTLEGQGCDDFGQPYNVFIRRGDPEPMIAALEETLERLNKE